jgi:ribulose bisphosphate carboxylase small subunit
MAYYIAPAFLKAVAIHITKNCLDLPNVRVPLILGIHGRKGEGKSFQCDLVFERMGVYVVHMSAGEFESPDAGDPARLIRLRYREAADIIRKHRRMAVMMINDLDAGAGRVSANTQYTVNTQLVSATLMNIADNPTNVQLPGSYDPDPLPRVPIIATGNDLTTLYSPLIRDGRMVKFYWDPTRADRLGIIGGIFQTDTLTASQVEHLADTFPDQAIDFFGALRSRLYDEQIWRFIEHVGLDKVSSRLLKSTEKVPAFPKPVFTVEQLIEFGRGMLHEQEQITKLRLAQEYISQGHAQEIPPLPTGSAPRGSEPTPPPPQSIPNTTAPAFTPSRLSPETLHQIQQWVAQGYRIGVEHVDERRFRMNSWQGWGSLLTSQSETVTALERCLADHPGEYIRLVGIDPQAKRRVAETVVQRP